MAEPNIDQAVQELLNMETSERDKVYQMHPDSQNLVEKFLQSNQDFMGLPAAEQDTVRRNYGLKPITPESSLAAAAGYDPMKTSMVPSPKDVMRMEVATRPDALKGEAPSVPFGNPLSLVGP